ncbi:hypothetical protein Tco_0438226 [Tanacetum coccineum]
MSHHKKIYVTPSHTKKIFANMKRKGKYFSGTITPLFQTMMVQAQEEMGTGSANPTDPHHTPTITQPSTSQPQKKKRRRKQRKDTEVSQPSGPTEPMVDETKNVESVTKHSNDPLLSGKDSLKLNELIELYTNLQKKVLDLETTKTIQALEIDSLKKRVKKLEKKQRSRTYKLRRLYKVSLSAKVIFLDDEASLGNQEDASKQGRKILDIVLVEIEKPVVNATTTTTTTVADEVEMNLAQTLIEIKSAKPKAKGIVMQEPKEQEELTIEEKSKLFQQLLEKRRKFFAAKRAEEKRNIPPTKAQQRSIITELVEGTKREESSKRDETIRQESSSKRVGDELEQEKAKKQKIDNDQEEAKLKELESYC